MNQDISLQILMIDLIILAFYKWKYVLIIKTFQQNAPLISGQSLVLIYC